MEKHQRLNEIRDELYDLANSFAGKETGAIGVELHQACNRIAVGLRMLKTGVTQEDNVRQVEEWADTRPYPVAHLVRATLADLLNS